MYVPMNFVDKFLQQKHLDKAQYFYLFPATIHLYNNYKQMNLSPRL